MRVRKEITWAIWVIGLILLVILAFVSSILIGEAKIKLSGLLGVLRTDTGFERMILTDIRIPRALLAFAVGGSLSLAGALLQGIYKNPLVEPYTLGISGGAALGVALVIVLGLNELLVGAMLPTAGFAGALLTIFLVYILSQRNGAININRMLLIGVMISFIASSVMMLLMAITTTDNLHSIVFWIMGSLDEPNSFLIRTMLFASLAGLLTSYFYARPLNALRLGEVKARHLGINTVGTIRVLFIIASLLTGLCVAVAGIIGFVGLIIPQVMRFLVGGDYRVLLLSSFLGGSFFVLICDIIARKIISPNELPIGVITGIVGGVVFISVLSKMFSKPKV